MGLLFGLVATALPDDLTDDQLLLARVLARMSENLKKLPNYTCLQTIERGRRASENQHFQPVDRVRLEVGLVDGKEMFSWPGAGNFEDRELADMVAGGAIGNGNFALHAKSVFVSGTPTFQYAGERVYEGRKTHRWDFRVPRIRSGYTIRNGHREAVVGYHGSFWADADTLDVVRLEVYADEIPPALEIVAAHDAMNYGRLRIGASDFLLPRSSELRMTDYGGESQNLTAFSGCRQYTGESVVRFDDQTTDTQVDRPPTKGIELPLGVQIPIALAADIKADTAAVGDAIEGIVNSNVKMRGTLLVPKGAKAHGRIVWLRKQANANPMWVVGLEFSEIWFGNTSARFRGRLTEVASGHQGISLTPPTMTRMFGVKAMTISEIEVGNMPGLLFARMGPVVLPKGLFMTWRTQASPEDKQ
jgi:hypothetical protein